MFRLVIFSCLFLATFAGLVRRRRPSHGRIVGGRDTDITEVPYQVSVRYDGSHECGGTIIGAKHILTAAHCVHDKDEDLFTIRAGSNHYYRGGQKVRVTKVIIHPNYDADSIDFDAAVLILKKLLTLNEKVKVATFANVEPRVGDMILISGWGSLRKGKTLAELLQSVSVPVVSKEVCKKKYGYDDDDITDQMFCAGYPKGGKDACEGDSGGPAMVNGKLAGIVSWGEDCGEEETPGVYTNIFKIKNWISTQIR